MPETEIKPLSVQELTARIRQSLESGFRNVWVEGELSNVRIQSSGHAYCTLKDARSQIPVAIFAHVLRTVPFRLADGVKVRILGSVTVYEPRGMYQLSAQRLEKVGAGDLMMQFEELKRKLQAEGVFDTARKLPLPLLPRRVGIVTSPTGAAIRDMLNVTRRRFPNMHIILYPARVQGEGAAAEIVAGIAAFNSLGPDLLPDVLIVGRGGGSIEDLWCFNEEPVARAIHASLIPVISAVGHETDFTISDFAADLRAPTPSAAAELVVGRKDDFLRQLETLGAALSRELRHGVSSRRQRLERARSHHAFAQPRTLILRSAQRIDFLEAAMSAKLRTACQSAKLALTESMPRLRSTLMECVASESARLSDLNRRLHHAAKLRRKSDSARIEALRIQLDALNPLAVLKRGYGVTRLADGSIPRSASELEPGVRVVTQLADGSFESVVTHAPTAAKGGATARKTAPRPRTGKKTGKTDPDNQLTLF